MKSITHIFAQEAGLCIAGALLCATLGYLACWLRTRHAVRDAIDRTYRNIENRKLRL
jgi:hypothetical protein